MQVHILPKLLLLKIWNKISYLQDVNTVLSKGCVSIDWQHLKTEPSG